MATDEELKLASIMRELVQTERSYVDTLLICEEVYYKPLDRSISSKSPLIDSAALSALFGNLDQVRESHQTILAALDAARDEFQTAGEGASPRPMYQKIGSVFAEAFPRMQQIYTTFLRSSEEMPAILKMLNKNKKFRQFCNECLFDPRSKSNEIEDGLIRPTQRIGDYKLLFERIIKWLPVETYGEEVALFTTARDSILQLGAMMNENKSDATSQESLLNIAETVGKIPSFMAILTPGRRYHGNVHVLDLDTVSPKGKRESHFNVYITSDVLIMVRFEGKKQVYYDVAPIRQLRITELREALAEYAKAGFTLYTDTHEYNIAMKSAEVKTQLLGQLKKIKDQIKDRTRKQTASGREYMQKLVGELLQGYTEPPEPRTREQAIASLA